MVEYFSMQLGEVADRARENVVTWVLVLCALGILTAMIIATCGWLTEHRDFALDDAYITYIYGENLAAGHGLRYNVGDAAPTEGSSSLLHVLLVSAGARLGIDPLTLTRGGSIAGFGILTLALAYLLSQMTRVRASIALVCAVTTGFALLYLPETFGHFGKGMETMLFFYLNGVFFAWALAFALKDHGAETSFQLLGILFGLLLILVRPEGPVIVFATLGALFIARLVKNPGVQLLRTIKELLPVGLGLTIVTGAYFAWKIQYFGDIYPTAYWVKSNSNIFGTNGSPLPGLRHVLAFLLFRWIPIALIVFVLLWHAVGQRMMSVIAILATPSLVITLLYMRAVHEVVGGFRYGFPHLAPLFVIGAVALALLTRKATMRLPLGYLAGITVIFSVGSTPYLQPMRSFETPAHAVTGWIGHDPEMNGIGYLSRDLAATGLRETATLLTSAAGILPYRSGFRTIDWLGLNNEQLSGKTPMTIAEVRDYINAQSPDVAMTVFPAASQGIEDYRDDPVFNSGSVKSTMNGRGVRLFKHWDQKLVSEMIWSQMTWFRDHTDFAACYPLDRNWAVLVYVTRTSPHYETLMETLGNSQNAGCDPERIKRFYNVVPMGFEDQSRPSDG